MPASFYLSSISMTYSFFELINVFRATSCNKKNETDRVVIGKPQSISFVPIGFTLLYVFSFSSCCLVCSATY